VRGQELFITLERGSVVVMAGVFGAASLELGFEYLSDLLARHHFFVVVDLWLEGALGLLLLIPVNGGHFLVELLVRLAQRVKVSVLLQGVQGKG
jgi:hypothetical protein